MTRSSIAASCKRSISLFFAIALTVGLMPASALASEEGEGASPSLSEDASSLVGADAPAQGAPRPSDVIDRDVALTTVAQAETTKSFFLAQTLESTRTVPMVSAKLPIDSGTDGKNAESGEGAEGTESVEGVSAGSTVVGAFEQDGMTFAIEADDGSVALMAVDYAKLPREFVSKQVVVIPDVVSSDGIDSFSVARIGSGAFSSLKKESADPAFASCEALFSDEELLAEAGIDPSEVEGFLSDDDAASAMQDDEDAIAPSDAQAGAGTSEDGSDPSTEEGVSAGPDGAEKVRAIVSVEGDVATLDDGSTYEFKNPLAGCAGILAAHIPASVSSIEDDAFEGSDTLQYLVVSDDNPEYASFDGALYSADLTTLRLIPEGRVGAVRIAPSAAEASSEALSHCASVDALVADAGSAAFIAEKSRSRSGDGIVLFQSTEIDSEMIEESIFVSVDTSLVEALERHAACVSDGESGFEGGDSVGFAFAPEGDGGRGVYSAAQSNYLVFASTGGSFTRIRYVHPSVGDDRTIVNGLHELGFKATSYATWSMYLGNPNITVNVNNGTYVMEGKLATNAGYRFAGWSDSPTGPVNIVTASTLSGTSGGGKIVYALFNKLPTYPIALDANASDAIPGSPVTYHWLGAGFVASEISTTVVSAGELLVSSLPTRPGYAFAGYWDTASPSGGTRYIDESGHVVGGTPSLGAGAATLYARWAPVTYGISYDDAGGSFSGKTGSYTIESNDFALPASGMRTGFTFAGWEVTGASGSGIEGNGTTNATVKKGTYGDLAAKAIWTINVYHLSWNVSHGTHANRTEDFTVEDCPIAMGEAVPDAGYAFLGWSGTGIAEGSASFALTGSMLEGKGDGETFAYVASFAANPYTARLHANDGTDAVAEHAVTYDAPVSPASVPKRYGYAFSGYWTKDADGSKEELYFDEDGSYVRDDVWKDPSDVDLYACWTLMANLEVPVNAPSAVSFTVDRALEIGEGASGTQAGPSTTGALRSSVPQEVPIASIELEPLQDADGTASASRVLGEGNPERCGVEVSLGSSSSALLRLADATGAPLRWEPPSPLAIPAAVPVASGTTGEDVTSDGSGNLARLGELPLAYAMKLFPGFDVYRMPAEDASSEPVARIVFTVDLTGLEREEF